MSFGELTDRTRAVVPRWRSLTNTPTVETIPTPNFPDINPATVAQFQDLLRIWRRNGRAVDAVDILDAGIACGSRSLVLEGARKVIKLADELRPEVVQRAHELMFRKRGFVAASSVLDEENDNEILRRKIKDLKQVILESPRNSLPHVEVARLYTRLGQLEKAEFHLRVAVSIAPHDRFTLRALTRFYTMVGAPEEALVFLWRSEALATDPWMMSAELSAAMLGGKSTRQAHKLGRRLQSQKRISRELSELATGWITKEKLAGSSPKRVLQTLRHTLVDPTENALAQGIWLTDRIGRDFQKTFPKIHLPQEAHEARALAFAEHGDFRAADVEARLWTSDQPFQMRAFLLTGFIKFVHLQDYEGVLRTIETGLTIHTNEWSLLNLGVLASSLLNDIRRAKEYLDRFERADKDEEGEIFLLAARGIFNFAQGNYNVAVASYMDCVRQCRLKKRLDLSVNATVFLLEMLCRHRSVTTKDVRYLEDKIQKAAKRLQMNENRDVTQTVRSRKKIWDEIISNWDEEPQLIGLIDTRSIEEELAEEVRSDNPVRRRTLLLES